MVSKNSTLMLSRQLPPPLQLHNFSLLTTTKFLLSHFRLPLSLWNNKAQHTWSKSPHRVFRKQITTDHTGPKMTITGGLTIIFDKLNHMRGWVHHILRSITVIPSALFLISGIFIGTSQSALLLLLDQQTVRHFN